MTAELVDRITEAGLARVKDVARKIATESPRLADLPAEDLERLARVVIAEGLKEELRKAADLEKVPYQEERKRFLERSSRSGSKRTRELYAGALGRLETWCSAQGISPLELNPARADDWIESLKAGGKAPSTVNLDVAAASSFWTWLERRHAALRNPFRGTRSRPAKKPRRTLQVPTDEEIRVVTEAATGWLKAAIAVMSLAGLRAGALPSLSITGERYTCTTKGKEHTGRIPAEARKVIQEAGLSLRSPFEGKTAHQIEDAFRYQVGKLYKGRSVAAWYSCHDLRHCFAVRLHTASHDIYQVKEALGHANVTVTEAYLRSLDLR